MGVQQQARPARVAGSHDGDPATSVLIPSARQGTTHTREDFTLSRSFVQSSASKRGAVAMGYEGGKKSNLFCAVCGDLLRIEEKARQARCSTCSFSCDVEEFLDVAIVSESGPRDWQKKSGVQPVIKENPELEKEVEHKRQVVDDECPKCGHKGLEFYT